jgi:hypothetical protein
VSQLQKFADNDDRGVFVGGYSNLVELQERGALHTEVALDRD